MKKLLLFFLLISSVTYAQLPIVQPNDMVYCDYDWNGIESFYLPANNTQLLNGLNSNDYSVSFYNSLANAEANTNQITNPTSFQNTTSPQTVYVRVTENANTTNFAITQFNLVVNLAPSFTLNDLNLCSGESGILDTGLSTTDYTFKWIFNEVEIAGATSSTLLVSETGFYNAEVTNIQSGCTFIVTKYVYINPFITVAQPENFIFFEDPFDNVAQFNLNLHTQYLTLNESGYIMSYHLTEADAQTGSNAISNSQNYSNISNPQTIYIRIEKETVGCFVIRDFDLIVQTGNDVINIADYNFKSTLLSASNTNQIAKDLNGNWIAIDVNSDGQIQFSEALNISLLDIQFVNINSLGGIEHFTNLLDINCSNNPLTELNFTSLINLQNIKCFNNQITQIQLPGSNTILSLEIGGNPISVLNLNNNTNIFRLHIGNTAISSLDIGNLTNLTEIHYMEGVTNLINFNNKSNITYLSLSSSTVTSFDFSLFPNIVSLDCHGTNLVVIDLSQNPLLTSLYASFNSSLEVLNLKNGGPSITGWQIVSNSALEYVCVNSYVSNSFINYLTNWNGLVNINSYCSVVPGGDYNTISGSMRFDVDQNGCTPSDFSLKYVKVDVDLNGTNLQAFSDNVGIYNFYTTEPGIYALTPSFENPTYFNSSPSPATVNLPQIDNSVTNQDFCITPNGVHPDLEIVIVPVLPARPGFDAIYKVVYKNKGNQVVTGYVNFYYNEAVLDYVSSSVAPGNLGGGVMNWVFPNLAPFQVGTILVTLNVNSPQETPAVNNGDVLAFNAFIDVSTDDNWADNSFNFNQIVVGSYDPNDITCLQGNSLPTVQMGNYLHYNIRFENTGTAPAENIVITSEIDLTQYNLQSLQVIESSHPALIRITGNIAEFIFQGIDLDTGGHGNILLKLKSNSTLSEDLVINSADIFFDYNFPIETNDEQTVFADLSKNDFNKDLAVQVYPNPAFSVVTVKSDATINAIQLYDAQGRLLITKMTNEKVQAIDLSSYATGLYYVHITTANGTKTEKLIKK